MKASLSIKVGGHVLFGQISKYVSRRSKSFLILAGVWILSSAFTGAVAQQQISRPGQATSSAPMASSNSDDTRYRIGPGDVLDVRVLKAPELSREEVRVDQRGMIRMPMLTDDIRAACLTEHELEGKIATLYLEYKRNPSVSVFVKDYQSQPVAVIGAVNNFQPQGTQFRLHRQVRLLEMLTLAGGLSDKAGRTVNVVHAGGPTPCEDGTSAPIAAANDLGALVTYQLSDTLKGVAEANPILRPGDIVVVPEGEQIYVVGNVMKPSTIALKEPLTVTRAIAIAGGAAQSTKKSRVRIVRQLPGPGGKQEIYVDLAAIEKRQAPDLNLMPNDIVDVPISGTKSFMRTLLGAVAPAVSQASVRVVP